jgi:transcriptional regulator with XRE-family HTH domain
MPTLKELRESQFMSTRDLAEKADISPNTVNRLELGLQKPNFKTIRILAKALKVKPGEIQFFIKE